VKCEIRIISGARAGHRDVFDKSYIGIGRHPLSDVRFDAERDLDASTRHAAILRTGETWVLRDLGSKNGTYINGQKLEADRELKDGDTLRFGVHGPEASFHVLGGHDHGEVVMEAVQAPPRESAAQSGAPAARATQDRSPAPPPPPPPPPPPAASARPQAPSATSVLRAQLREQTSRIRAVTVVLIVVMVAAAALLMWQGATARQEREQVRSILDSLGQELVSLKSAKVAADSQVARLSRQLAAETNPARRRMLQQQVTDWQQRAQNIAAAQTVDYNAIVTANDRAVAMIYVRFSDTTQMWTGTAFSVSSGGAMLTNRHVVTNDRGERPRDIAIRFSGSREVHPARLVRVAPDADLALVQLESRGPFPTVAGLASAAIPAPGEPIALLGFPGGELDPASGSRTTLVTGSLSRVVPDSLLQLDAFSGVGASGSPIFDRTGRVIGVEFGGVRESGGRIILGLPIRRALALLAS
jgi:S1-C subfamily serine protease